MTTTTGHFKGGHGARRGGYTLVELLVAMGIFSMAMASFAPACLYLYRTAYCLGNYSLLNKQSRHSLEVFGRDARLAKSVLFLDETGFTLEMPPAPGPVYISYEYKPAERKLYRSGPGAPPMVLLRDIQQMTFSFFNLRGQETSTVLAVKEIQLDALLLRRVQNLQNTQNVMSSRITLRNKTVIN